MHESTIASTVVGTYVHFSPRMYTDATNADKSCVMPPPTATRCVCRLAPLFRIASMMRGDASSDLFVSTASTNVGVTPLAAAPSCSNRCVKKASLMTALLPKPPNQRENAPASTCTV